MVSIWRTEHHSQCWWYPLHRTDPPTNLLMKSPYILTSFQENWKSFTSVLHISPYSEQLYPCTQVQDKLNGPGGYSSISLTGMLVREKFSATQKNRMSLNSNPRIIELTEILQNLDPKNRITQYAHCQRRPRSSWKSMRPRKIAKI